MKIFFTNPPLRELHFSRSQRSPGVIKSGTMYYPYWLAHAAALAESRDHEIYLLDCPADFINRDGLLQEIQDQQPDLIVLDTSTPSINFDLQTVVKIRQITDAKILMVGTHVTSEWHHCLEACAELDFIAMGEYDFSVSELAEALERNALLNDIAGLAYRDHSNNGALIQTDVRLPIENMDELPWIAPIYKRFLTPENYLFTIASQPMIMLIGGRGCKAKCFYCVYPQVMHGHNYRTRSLPHLIGEMKWIEENMPEIKEIVFEDDTFTSDRQRAKDFAAMIKSEGIRLPFFANIRTNVDRETLAALKTAGLRECAVGFESGDDLILANMRKGQNVKAQRQFMDNCKDLGILVHGCFMVGFPGETKETMAKTLALSMELNPDSAQFYPVMPYPGTSAYQWAKDNNYLTSENFDDWLDEHGAHQCVLNLPGLSTSELESFCEHAFRKYHFRPRYIVRKLTQALTNPKEGLRSINAGLNFLTSIFTREKDTPKTVHLLPKDEHWREKSKVPYGRMEQVENVIKLINVDEIDGNAAKEALRSSEQLTERS